MRADVGHMVRPGHLTALVGAALLLAALWLPWFEVQLGPLERGELAGVAGGLGAPFAAAADGLLAALDGFKLTAWTAFDGEDVALAAGAGGVALLVLADGGALGPGIRVDGAVAARAAVLGGVVLGALVTVRLVARPGPSELLQLAPGGYVALTGCALMCLGGKLAVRLPAGSTAAAAGPPAAWAPEPCPTPGSEATSVAPPLRRS